MANGFFSLIAALVGGTLGRAEGVNNIFRAVEAGFDKLPSENEIKQGRICYGVDTGTANAKVATIPYPPLAYEEGLGVQIKVNAANTGPATLNLGGLGVKAIKRLDGSDLVPNDLPAGCIVDLRYDGDVFRLTGAPNALVAGALISAQQAAASALAASNSAGDALGYTNDAQGYASAAQGYASDAAAASIVNNMPTATIKGRAASGTGAPQNLTAAQTRTLLGLDAPTFPGSMYVTGVNNRFVSIDVTGNGTQALYHANARAPNGDSMVFIAGTYGQSGQYRLISTGLYPMLFSVDNTERFRITPDGLGFIFQGANTSLATIRLNGTSGASARLQLSAGGRVFSMQSDPSEYGVKFIQEGVGEFARFDTNANWLLGVTSSAGASHRIVKNGLSENGNILNLEADGVYSAIFAKATSTQQPNASGSALLIKRNVNTARSINAAGTVNATGADYAEYLRKASGCGTIAPGDVCGVNADGELTDTFADAHSFVIKSTEPAYVGGDTWGAALGDRPLHDPEGEETEEDFATRLGRWEADLEAERIKWDRIAFSGQVPVNVTGATAGLWIDAAEGPGGSIIGVPTDVPSALTVGKVWKVLPDGRAWVAVRIAA